MSWIDGLRHRVHVWLHRDEYAREQAEERRFHREMEAMHGQSGRDGPVAAAGGPDRFPDLPSSPDRRPDRERSMGSRLFDHLRQDIGYAMRGLVRSPGFTALAALTLALGVGANAAVFSVLDRMFGQSPAGLHEPDGLRRLYVQLPEHPLEPGMVFPWFNYPAFSAVDEAVAGRGEVAAWTPSAEGAALDGQRELTVRRSYVTHDYFAVLGVDAARGRLFGEEEARVDMPSPVAVISHAFWERAFASDAGVLGRTLEMDSTAFTVVGVTPEGFAGLDLSLTDVFVPWARSRPGASSASRGTSGSATTCTPWRAFPRTGATGPSRRGRRRGTGDRFCRRSTPRIRRPPSWPDPSSRRAAPAGGRARPMPGRPSRSRCGPPG